MNQYALVPRSLIALLRIGKIKDASHTDLREADLRGADLRGAGLRRADLWEADLRGADLRGAGLRGADLREADLRGTDLRGTNIWSIARKGDVISIGCQTHHASAWAAFSDAEINAMDPLALVWWKQNRSLVLKPHQPVTARPPAP